MSAKYLRILCDLGFFASLREISLEYVNGYVLCSYRPFLIPMVPAGKFSAGINTTALMVILSSLSLITR